MGENRVSRTLRAPLAALFAGGLVVALGSAPAWASAYPSSSPAPSGGTGSGGGLAGFTLQARSAAVRVTFNIPGLVPITHPLMEVNVPYADTTASSGPTVEALGSPLYPGYPAANLGSEIPEFSSQAPSNIPNYPVVAQADYPASAHHGSSASFPSGGQPASSGTGPAASVGSVSATASASAASVTATAAKLGFDLPAQSTGLFSAGSFDAGNEVTYGASSVDSGATSSVGSITIAGLVHIAGIESSAGVSSDGSTTKPVATLHIGAVTVDGQKAYIDQYGVHIVGQSPTPAGVPSPAEVSSVLDHTLQQDQLTIRELPGKTSTDASTGAVTATSGALEITIERSIPLPPTGLPPIPLPGLGNFSPGTSIPTVTTIDLGYATSTVNATALPSFSSSNSLSMGGSFPSSLSGSGQYPSSTFGTGNVSQTFPASGPGSSLSAALGNPGTGGTSGGPSVLEASPAGSRKAPPLGFPVPFGWVVAGIAASVVLSGPLLFYSRWQLLVGRRR
ncbi:MAG: hypothetical protein ACYCUF_11400 [Acidimicrobiales bacterium]